MLSRVTPVRSLIGGRRSARDLLTGICVLAALLPAAGVAAAQTSDPATELEEVQDQLDDARSELEEVEGQQVVTVADLEQADARRRELGSQLAALEGELAGAESSLARAEDALSRTTSALTETQARLASTQAELADNREDFEQRVRSTYMYGAVDPSAMLLKARTVSEFQRALGYVGVVLDADRVAVETVANLEREVAEDAENLAGLQQRQASETAVAQGERDRVAGLVADQRRVTDEAQAEAERHQLILAQLEGDEQSHVQLIAVLEGDSARLTGELRARAAAAEEAAAAAAAEAAAAASAARRASEQVRPSTGPTGSTGSTGESSVEVAAGPPPASKAGALQRPVDGPITSGYGYRIHPIFGISRLHTGIDFSGPSGTPIYAADGGVVVSAGGRGGYGNATVVDHGGGMATLYAHQSRLGVSAGERVERGQVIGYVGSTGISTGPHLHFEVRIDGQPVDPAAYL